MDYMADSDERVWCIGLMSGVGDFAAKVRKIDLIDRPPVMSVTYPTLMMYKPNATGDIQWHAGKWLSNFPYFTGEPTKTAEWQVSGVVMLRPASEDFSKALDNIYEPKLIVAPQ